MRGMIQDKLSEDGSGLAKEREKSKALFLEVVRLGENNERLQEGLSTSMTSVDQRLLALETKVY
jgi:hypothetical protein